MSFYANEGPSARLVDLGPDRHVPRPFYMIYTDLQTLTVVQKNAVWNDLSSGTPKKYLTDEGPQCGAIAALDWAVSDSGATGQPLASARLRIISMYCMDHPDYLVSPAFDPTINIPGSQPA